MDCWSCGAAASGICGRCRRPCCDRHWGGPATPRCERCHRTASRIWTAGGLVILALAAALFLFTPFAVSVVLVFVGAGLLCVGAVSFRSAAARAAAEKQWHGSDAYDDDGDQ